MTGIAWQTIFQSIVFMVIVIIIIGFVSPHIQNSNAAQPDLHSTLCCEDRIITDCSFQWFIWNISFDRTHEHCDLYCQKIEANK